MTNEVIEEKKEGLVPDWFYTAALSVVVFSISKKVLIYGVARVRPLLLFL